MLGAARFVVAWALGVSGRVTLGLGRGLGKVFCDSSFTHHLINNDSPQVLGAAGCVVAPVARVSEVCADQQLRANGVFQVRGGVGG